MPLIWLPFVALAFASAALQHGTPALACAAAAAAGFLAWLLVEYLLHRFVFHARPTSYAGITLHFAFHGCHHKHPADRLRLVFPPLFAAPLVAAFLAAFRCALPGAPGLAHALWGGMLGGYVCYDCTHYATHHAGASGGGGGLRWLARVRTAHLAHHYADSTRSFGVSGDLFDRVFGTMPGAKRRL